MRRILKIGVTLLVSVLFLALMAYSSLESETVQRKLRSYLGQTLSEELNTEVRVGRLGWNPIEGFTVADAYIADQAGDTLFFIGETKAKLRLYDGVSHKLFLHMVSLDQVLVNFRQYPDSVDFNYQFFIDAVSGGPQDTSRAPVIWTVFFRSLELSNADFHFRMEDTTDRGRRFNEGDFRFSGISARLEDFYIVDDSLNFRIRGLQFREANSFELRRLDADATISATGMHFNNLLLETPNSRLTSYFGMEYKHWRSFNQFESEVVMKTRLEQSRVSFEDIRLFSDELGLWSQVFTISGEAEGPLNRIKASNLDIRYGQKTRLEGDVSLRGLPDIAETFIEARLSTAQSNSDEIAQMIMLGELPDELDRLGLMKFKGNYVGFIYDFVAFGDFQTALGSLSSDLNMKLGKIPVYSGNLEAIDFDLGRLLGLSGLGKISFAGEVNGEGFTLKDMDTRLTAEISQFQMAGYHYQNLRINGKIAEQLFEGSLEARDPNLQMAFDGKVRLDQHDPVVIGTGKLYHAQLKQLNWGNEFDASLSAEVEMDFRGSRLDDLLGMVAVRQLKLVKDGRVHQVDSLLLRSVYGTNYRKITLHSDLLDARIEGNFLPSQLDKSFNNFLAQLLPNTLALQRVPLESEQFSFDVDLKRTRDLTSLIRDDFWVADGSVSGSFNAGQNSLALRSMFSQVHYGEFEFSSLTLSADSSVGDQPFNIDLSCREIMRNDSNFADGVVVNLGVKKNEVDFAIKANSNPYASHIRLNGNVDFRDSGMFARLGHSGVTVDGQWWEVQSGSALALIHTNQLLIEDFGIAHRNQKLRVSGQLRGDRSDRLKLDLQAFDLSVLNHYLFPDRSTSVHGLAEGHIDILSFSGAIPLFVSNLKIDSLGVNKELLGDLSLMARVPEGYELITVSGLLKNGYTDRLKVEGFVRTARSAPSYNLQVSLDTTPLVVLQPFMDGLVSEIQGKGIGRVMITGALENPDLNGTVSLMDAGMKVDYLNTRYRFNSRLTVGSKRIEIKRFELKDENGNTGYCSGFIRHHFFSDIDLNIELGNLKNFLCLNTGPQDNEDYYGTALLTGSARFTGSPDNLVIDVKGRAEKGSRFFVPLEGSSGSSELAFIRFVNFDDYGSFEPYQDFSGIQLNFDLEITPSTEIQLIFDSKLGDIIRARGYSNLKLLINSNGDFRMYGEYEVVEGDYLFTAVNLINKKFVIDPGGKIVWNGDPMKANLNIDAVYHTKASPENLLRGVVSDAELANFRQRTDVEAILKLRGELTSPEIHFGFRMPDMASMMSSGTNVNALQTVLRRIEGDQEEMTRQVFSLLVANTFIPPAVNRQFAEGASGVESGLISSSVGDLLSNQITNWLSGINKDWNLGVNYVFGNDQSAVILNYSQKFFDDRLEIGTSLSSNASFYNNISATYRVTPDGRVRIRAFNRTGSLPGADPNTPGSSPINRNINTQGMGIYYRIEFDFLTGERRKLRQQKKREAENPD